MLLRLRCCPVPQATETRAKFNKILYHDMEGSDCKTRTRNGDVEADLSHPRIPSSTAFLLQLWILQPLLVTQNTRWTSDEGSPESLLCKFVMDVITLLQNDFQQCWPFPTASYLVVVTVTHHHLNESMKQLKVDSITKGLDLKKLLCWN